MRLGPIAGAMCLLITAVCCFVTVMLPSGVSICALTVVSDSSSAISVKMFSHNVMIMVNDFDNLPFQTSKDSILY